MLGYGDSHIPSSAQFETVGCKIRSFAQNVRWELAVTAD
jgi:hypothetical protein